jgi:hypothetical protein
LETETAVRQSKLKEEMTIMIFASLVFASLLQPPQTNCLLSEGVGGEIGIIGGSRQGAKRPGPRDVQFTYSEKGTLDGIYVFPGSACQTAKGIKVGDPENKVRKIYGKGKKTHPTFKGEPLGEFALEYDGVQFVITQSMVAAFFIVPPAGRGPSARPGKLGLPEE